MKQSETKLNIKERNALDITMKALLIGLIAMVAIAAGVFAAGLKGYGPIAYISYHVKSSNSSSAEIIPAYINLGNLTPGMKGNASANALIVLYKNGTYEIKLLHEDKLSDVFSTFNVTVTIGNKTVVLSLSNDEAVLNLTPGNYTVYIKIFYQVSNNPEGDLNVNHEPLLIIHPYEEGDQNVQGNQG